MSCICIVFHIDQTLYDLTIPWIRKVRESHEWIELNEFPKQILFEMSMAFFATFSIQISHFRIWAIKFANHTRQTAKHKHTKKLISKNMRMSMNYMLDRRIALKINQTMIASYQFQIFRQHNYLSTLEILI